MPGIPSPETCFLHARVRFVRSRSIFHARPSPELLFRLFPTFRSRSIEPAANRIFMPPSLPAISRVR